MSLLAVAICFVCWVLALLLALMAWSMAVLALWVVVWLDGVIWQADSANAKAEKVRAMVVVLNFFIIFLFGFNGMGIL
ncbi:hypothetical protein DQF64_02625 [Moraxella bovis]|nr:hypothetical protein DQF64_02625 [Moraxella bovis]